MHRTIFVLGLGLATACSSNQDIETVYDPCSPLTIAVDADLNAMEAVGVDAAIQTWARVLPIRMSVGAGSQAADVLPIRFESGDSFYRAIYWDAIGLISISRDRLEPKAYALAIAHEMGHAFGLLHVAEGERPSIMNVGNLEVTPTAEDVAEIRALWTTCSDSPGNRTDLRHADGGAVSRGRDAARPDMP